MRYFLVMIFSISLLFGGAKVEGWVYDNQGDPIPYASVGIKETNLGTVCNERGYFVIIEVPTGRYDIEASCVGYQTQIRKDILVRTGHPVELQFQLKGTPIKVKPIISVAKEPKLTKEMVGTTIVVDLDEPDFTPTTYPLEKIMIQPAVVYTGTTFHVRGGRSTEVLYLVDNVPIIDPQNGELGFHFHQGMVEEAIFFPGTFGVEYGGALSGVVSIISPRIAHFDLEAQGKTEKPMTEYSFSNLQSAFTVSPVLLSADVTTTDDWDPRLALKPHKQRQDYCVYGKSRISLKENLKLNLGGARSRTQFDRYHPDWYFRLDHYRSDLRIGNLVTADLAYLPRSNVFFDAIISYAGMEKEYGVRAPGEMLPYQTIGFRDYKGYEIPRMDRNNPTGWNSFFYSSGEYPEYGRSRSGQYYTKISSKIQLNPNHELHLGVNGCYYDIYKHYILYPYEISPVLDDYRRHPREFGFYIEDGIEYYDLFVKIGSRFDRYYNDLGGIVNAASPRIGFSFSIEEDLLLRANIGRYVQPPLFDQMYSLQGYEHDTLPDGSPMLIGNPELKPERTIATEIGFQGRVAEGINATTTFFYKDVSDLIGSELILSLPRSYFKYLNVDYASIKGMEFVFSFYRPFFEGRLSYTLSYAEGSSSYATEGYYEYVSEHPDSVIHYPKSKYPLDFDQRHRIFLRTTFHLPRQVDLFTYLYLGSGFPYTPPGGKGDPRTMNILQQPFRKDLGISLSRKINLGGSMLAISLEILNVLDIRDIRYVYPATGLPDDNGLDVDREDFTGNIPIENRYYHPGQDVDHDGYITGREAYVSYLRANQASIDWTNNYGPSRRFRLGLSFRF